MPSIHAKWLLKLIQYQQPFYRLARENLASTRIVISYETEHIISCYHEQAASAKLQEAPTTLPSLRTVL